MSLWIAMLLNLGVLIALAFFGSLTYRDWPTGYRYGRLLRLITAMISAVLLVLIPAQILPGFQIDLRSVPVALMAFYYGPVWGLLAALPMTLLRLSIGGAGAVPSLYSTAALLLICWGLRRFSQQRGKWWHGFIMFGPLPLALLLAQQGPHVLKLIWLPSTLVHVAGYLIVQSVYAARLQLLKLARDFRLQARTDSLTGVWNRRQFQEDLSGLLPGDHLVLLDIDHFKRVNDELGHDVGDEVLAQVAETLVRSNAPGRVYRLGGEEFALLLRRTAPEQARARAEQCWTAVRNGSYHSSSRLSISCSLGLAALRVGEDSQGLFQRADEALYRAKSQGRDQVIYGNSTAEQRSASTQSSTIITSASEDQLAWYTRWKAMLATLELVGADHELTDEDWDRVIQAAVYCVPDAEAGSLVVRQGDEFVIRAQVGFHDALLGTRTSDAGQQIWYGAGSRDYLAGLPRVVRGAEIERYSRQTESFDQLPERVFGRLGRSSEIQASLCVPVVVDGEVAAILNLDNLHDQQAFQRPALEVAREFSVQIAALIRAALARRQRRQRQRELEALTRLSLSLRGSHTETEILQVLVQEACALLQAQDAVFLIYERASDSLISGPRCGQFAHLDQPPLQRSSGLVWAALSSNELHVSDDARHEARMYFQPSRQPVALLAAPFFTAHSGEIGVLVLTRELTRPFGPQDQQLMRGIVSLALTAIERARHLSQLEAGREGAFQALGLALEARDFETQGHARRVVSLAARFAARLGLDAQTSAALVQGAYLHDIGKLQVPDRILLKPGKLDAQEWALMQQHSVWGFEIARRVPGILPGALDLILHHHERFDGSGYPHGLSGQTVPLLARVFSIIDSYDALVHVRPYKPAWSIPEALAELRAQAGRQFDPQLIEPFIQVARQNEGALLQEPQIEAGLSLFDALASRP